MAEGIILSQVLGFFSLSPEGTLLVPTVTKTLGNMIWKGLCSGWGGQQIETLDLYFRGSTNF